MKCLAIFVLLNVIFSAAIAMKMKADKPKTLFFESEAGNRLAEMLGATQCDKDDVKCCEELVRISKDELEIAEKNLKAAKDAAAKKAWQEKCDAAKAYLVTAENQVKALSTKVKSVFAKVGDFLKKVGATIVSAVSSFVDKCKGVGIKARAAVLFSARSICFAARQGAAAVNTAYDTCKKGLDDAIAKAKELKAAHDKAVAEKKTAEIAEAKRKSDEAAEIARLAAIAEECGRKEKERVLACLTAAKGNKDDEEKCAQS